MGAVLLGLGVLDWLTWGGPWHSAWSYFHFNIASGSSASQFGRQPGWWYAPIFAGMAPLLLLWHFARGLARRDVLVGAFVFYLGVVSALGHKEARFLVPLLPLFIVDGEAVEEDSLRATGFCLQRRWDAVALWTRCPAP
ncbi:MAG TPA: hypothetical protein VK458_12200 [Myxococcaceae bacterium]|nr:hypothetical protein [Myxococcaceae bacterium]